MLKELFVSDKKVCYWERGEGPVLIFLHGYLENYTIWKSLFPFLEGYRIVAVDLPGHGESDGFHESFEMKDLGEWLHQFLSLLQISSAHFIAHSMGGYVALAFAHLNQDFVHSLYLVHSTPLQDPPKRAQMRLKEIQFLKSGKRKLLLSQFASKLFSSQNAKIAEVWILELNKMAELVSEQQMILYTDAMSRREDYCEFLSTATFFTSLMVGKHDYLLPVNRVELLKNILPSLDIQTFLKSGHLSFIEETQEFISFLNRSLLNNA